MSQRSPKNQRISPDLKAEQFSKTPQTPQNLDEAQSSGEVTGRGQFQLFALILFHRQLSSWFFKSIPFPTHLSKGIKRPKDL
jgi:hypothetical protein